MGDTRGFRTHEGILADVLVTVWNPEYVTFENLAKEVPA